MQIGYVDITVIVQIVMLLTVLLGLVKVTYELRIVRHEGQEVHRIVNSQHDALVRWAKVMQQLLKDVGVEAPNKPLDVDMRQSGEYDEPKEM